MTIVIMRTLIACLFCFTSSIFITLLNMPIYLLSIYLFHINILSVSQLLTTYGELLQFLLLPKHTFHLSYFDISKEAIQHFYDVKVLIQVNCIVMVISGLLTILSKKYIVRQVYPIVKLTLRTVFVIFFVIILAMIINFEGVFILFHQIFFSHSYWQFDITKDAIILALPQQFFMLCFIEVITLCSLLMTTIKNREE